ncbi:MAG: glycosyltransferase family 2 protein [Candidatus Hydrogenedentes bacterium]|nr:glycosyltransferase family 2 protein [Candidatus Hydrogenedentota bacterium]
MSGETSPALTVVIPTWNGWDLLHDCLESLRRQTFQASVYDQGHATPSFPRTWESRTRQELPKTTLDPRVREDDDPLSRSGVEPFPFQGMEIIVVDDGSTDETPAHLKTEFPEVQCLVSPVNLGFAATANRGLAAARAPWVFLLNNDVTLAEDCIEKLMACAREGTYSMISPMVLWAEDPQLIYSAGDGIGVNGRPVSLGYKEPHANYVPESEPFGVSGGYGLFRKTMLDEIGLLDEAFVAYFEDSDLCFRARWAGHAATLVPDARARHIGSASIQGRTWWRTRQCFQNHALLVLKNYSLPLLWKNLGPIMRERCHQWSRVFRVARSEWGTARAVGFTLAAWWGLMRRVPSALHTRQGILRKRRIDNNTMQVLLEKEPP